MIDLESVKRSADLLAICQALTPLKKHSNTNGGEWCGPCPFCGGEDRFYVQPLANPFPRWACRQCTPGGDTVIGLVARRDNLDPKRDFVEICNRATGGTVPTTTKRAPQTTRPAYSPPAMDWQKAAAGVIEKCQEQLWQPGGEKWLQYLRNRGLKDLIIKYFRLGCSSGEIINGLFVPKGVLIPCVVAGEIWYLKVRQPPEFTEKYKLVIGSRPAALFNADNLSSEGVSLFCEGEFDCMIAWQELFDVIPAATMGASTNTPDLATWGAYLISQRVILSAYDSDQAGEEGSDRLYKLAGNRVKLCPVPSGKDINEFYLDGGDLWHWIKPYLNFYD